MVVDADYNAPRGYSFVATISDLLVDDTVDALMLTYPDFAALDGLPADIRGAAALPESTTWPKTYLQIATHDEVVDEAQTRAVTADAEDITTAEYVSRHRISTPEVARSR